MCLYMSYDVDEPQFVLDLSPVFVLLDGQGNQGTSVFSQSSHGSTNMTRFRGHSSINLPRFMGLYLLRPIEKGIYTYTVIELDDGKIYRKPLCLMVKTHGFPVDFPLNQSIECTDS